ncbi:MAG: hypothetical protein JWM25_1074 [Thermoleophilia bacterium]|nr:hypothetical protein [Thermoleophilia bacterium]
MSGIEINPNTYAAPVNRPPGMDPVVPYQPMIGMRNAITDWLTVTAVKGWFATPGPKLLARFNEWMDGNQPPKIEGRPGAPLPDAGATHRIAVFGDMGEGSPAQARNATQALKWKPTHVATTGDNVYPLGREVDFQKRFDPEFADLMRTATWKPSLGNHDYYSGTLEPYFNRFPEAKSHAYYSWKLGEADFFVLDTEQRLDIASAQRAWLEQELAASDAPYKVVQMHRPMVASNAGRSGADLEGSLAPLMAKYGVQLVLQGHEHGYERSKQLDGTTYVVTGGGGASAFRYLKGLPERSEVRSTRHHHLQLSFDAGRMVVRGVDDLGSTFDTFAVAPHGVAGAATASEGARVMQFTPPASAGAAAATPSPAR